VDAPFKAQRFVHLEPDPKLGLVLPSMLYNFVSLKMIFKHGFIFLKIAAAFAKL